MTYSLLVSVLRWARRSKFYALTALLNVGIPQIRRIGPAPTRCRATRYNYYRGLKSRVAFICRMTKCENLKIRANLRIHQTWMINALYADPIRWSPARARGTNGHVFTEPLQTKRWSIAPIAVKWNDREISWGDCDIQIFPLPLKNQSWPSFATFLPARTRTPEVKKERREELRKSKSKFENREYD